ncbi:Mce-associated membrane protein [Gordonia amarae]|uniref:Mce-associated membrane protein n=1 Tax=Gordonia amarae NBRC 15530 TaxID=1075090 RepID=G7GTT5_9ACTN|nr:hypothetical protein [Gordonia amarae]MCS3877762.1 Mce-associated membrane protein [Gordonia amarae]GAB07010.1 hypothetical protein GOAMR_61_01060 [Gordonia amarae NBRC 15530]
MTRTLSDRTDEKADHPVDEADADTVTSADESGTTESGAEESAAAESVAEDSAADSRATADDDHYPADADDAESAGTSTDKSPKTKAPKTETPKTKTNDEDDAKPATEKAEKKSGPSVLSRLRTTLGSARSRRIGVIVLALLAVAGVAGTAWFGTQWRSAENTDKAADAAVVAARQFTTTLTSVSANSLDKDFNAVLAGSAGEFHQMYAKSSDQLRQLLIDNKAQAKGTVLASGVVSASTDKVVVVMFVDQTVQNVSNTQPRIDRSRIRVTMTKHDGRWLAEKVELP